MKNISYDEIIDSIKKELVANNIEPTTDVFDKFEKYYKYLVEYNNNVNLTAITDKDEVYIKHFLDSIKYINQYNKGSTVCDIGTGAGFPGVVLKIVRPDLKITLVDSLNKRIIFLNNLIKLLKLDNITALHSRAEDIVFKNNYLNHFDYVVARAVAELPTLTEYCLPFVNTNGYFIAYKGSDCNDEIQSAKKCIAKLGGVLDKIYNYSIIDNKRTLILIKKIQNTDGIYPRGQNKPRLFPIK